MFWQRRFQELLKRDLPIVLAALLSLASGASAGTERLQEFAVEPLAIKTADGVIHRLAVEIAQTPAQRTQGLMYRRSMAPDAGMLFDYQHPQRVAMWMKNTFLPLDILFITADGRISRIAERAVPQSLATIDSGGAVRGVLELNAGTADRLKLGVGDMVHHQIFGTALPNY